METIAIFGATGSIGVDTALYLREKGYNVIAIGHRKYDNNFFAENGIDYYSVDIKDQANFRCLPKNIDIVVHFAGAMPARMKGYNPYEYLDTIIRGTLNILEFMRENKIFKIIFSQSISDVLYKMGSLTPIDDDEVRKFPLNTDHSIYSICKNSAVNLIEHYFAKYGIKRFILRLPTIYVYHPSPYYYVNGERKWMGYRLIIDKAIKGEPIEIWGNPSSKKEMVYIKDFVQLVYKCVVSTLDGGIYNVGCPEPISIENQIKIIVDVFAGEKKSSISYNPNKPSSPQFILNINKARQELGYEPQYNFRRMMEDFKQMMIEEPFSKLWGTKKDYVYE